MRTHESLYTFPVLSRRSARARTPERLLYKTKTYIYIAARVAWNHFLVRIYIYTHTYVYIYLLENGGRGYFSKWSFLPLGRTLFDEIDSRSERGRKEKMQWGFRISIYTIVTISTNLIGANGICEWRCCTVETLTLACNKLMSYYRLCPRKLYGCRAI